MIVPRDGMQCRESCGCPVAVALRTQFWTLWVGIAPLRPLQLEHMPQGVAPTCPTDVSPDVWSVGEREPQRIALSEEFRQPLVRGCSAGEQRDSLVHWHVQRHLGSVLRILNAGRLNKPRILQFLKVVMNSLE